MKNVVAKMGLLAVMTVIAASVSANAQSLNYRLTANIPFDFSVGGEKLSAGKYWISRAQQSNGDTVVQIRSTDLHSNLVRFTIPVLASAPAKNSSLVFRRYGDEYFLAEIWPMGSETGRELPRTRAERELARKAQDSGVAAVNAPDVKTITITAN
jgi:hypothetical protein